MAWLAVAGGLAVAGVAPLTIWLIAVLAWIVAAERS
jgi:hypothetical protein